MSGLSEKECEVRDDARLLYQLLDDPEPGLFTWCAARNQIAARLRDRLQQLLGDK